MLYGFLIFVHVVVSIVLILVILLQAGKGGGLSESFGVSSTQTMFGTSATKFLTRATSVCAVIFLLTCLSLAALSTQRSRSLMDRQRFNQAVQPANVSPETAKTEAPAVQPQAENTPKEATSPLPAAPEKK